MGKIPTCKGCGKPITPDDKEYFYAEKHGSRWWHNECWEHQDDLPKVENKPLSDRDKIHQYMKNLCPTEYVKSRVDKQITSLKKHGRTEKGILLTLGYWYEKKHHNPEESHGGIGIVEYVYNEAQEYFQEKERRKEKLDSVSQETIEKIKKNQEASSGACMRRERVTKPRGVYMFHLE